MPVTCLQNVCRKCILWGSCAEMSTFFWTKIIWFCFSTGLFKSPHILLVYTKTRTGAVHHSFIYESPKCDTSVFFQREKKNQAAIHPHHGLLCQREQTIDIQFGWISNTWMNAVAWENLISKGDTLGNSTYLALSPTLSCSDGEQLSSCQVNIVGGHDCKGIGKFGGWWSLYPDIAEVFLEFCTKIQNIRFNLG